MSLKVVAVIPARYGSTRLPAKMLVEIAGRTVIAHVYEKVARVPELSEVVVATDDARIFDAVRAFGGKAIMTASTHKTGTDRVAEAAAGIDADVIVNVQGDEIGIHPGSISEIIAPFLADPGIEVTNLISRITDPADLLDNTVVKLVCDVVGNIMCYSRLPFPYPRDRSHLRYLRQLGVYGFKRSFLLEYAKWKQTPLEITEGVEFLRILENGRRIRGVLTEHESMDIDTVEDLTEVKRLLEGPKAATKQTKEGA